MTGNLNSSLRLSGGFAEISPRKSTPGSKRESKYLNSPYLKTLSRKDRVAYSVRRKLQTTSFDNEMAGDETKDFILA